ncbi:MAG: methyltransferase domain-containing protein [Acidobacteria bacterium]|nr:methyltransferase domain-containing protein [Acidobacteriota bacterium]
MAPQATRQARVFADEAFADRYARKHQKMALKFGQEYTGKLKERNVQQGRILDVGCGFGTTLLALAKTFPACEMTGIDLSDPLLARARAGAAAAGLQDRVVFEKADAEQLPYPDNAFDVALNINMVHIVAEPVSMLNEIHRVLKPEGLFFIADIRRSWIGLLDREFRSAYDLAEARKVVGRSRLTGGEFQPGFLWWRYER